MEQSLVPLYNESLHQQHECQIDVDGGLGRGLDERYAERVSKLLGHRVVDGARRLVTLVADQHELDVLGRVAVEVLHPLLDVLERLFVGDVVHDHDAVRAAVVAGRHVARRARRVPDLEADWPAIDLDRAVAVVDALLLDEALDVGVLVVAQQQARLADVGVTQKHDAKAERRRGHREGREGVESARATTRGERQPRSKEGASASAGGPECATIRSEILLSSNNNNSSTLAIDGCRSPFGSCRERECVAGASRTEENAKPITRARR